MVMTTANYTPDTQQVIQPVRTYGIASDAVTPVPGDLDSLPSTNVITTVGGFTTQIVYIVTTGGHTYTRTKTLSNNGTDYTGGSDTGWVVS